MNKIKNFLPDALAIVFFIVVSFLYFLTPTIEGLVISGHDHTAGVGAGMEMQRYKERTGERTRWTNSLFSGMPTYQMAPSYDSTDALVGIQKVYQLGLPTFVMYLFVMLLGFYIMLRAFNFKVWMAMMGAVLWAYSSYFLIIIGAGHIWKLMTLAYIPPTIAGMVWAYRGKYLWGGVVTALFLALQVLSNHVQMSYYFIPVLAAVALAYLIEAIRNKKVAQWGRATGVILFAAVLGVAANVSNLYHTYEYSKHSMRSKSELTQKANRAPDKQTKNGLDRDYITNWSYGIDETWSLLVPNVKGGASVPLSKSEEAMKEANPQYMPIYQQMGQYWGEQPGTSGPVYVGAFVLMLFVLSWFIVKGPLKWCLLVITAITVMLSWGRNMMWFTDLFLDYVPLYDKFRTVASILVVAEFTIPLLAMFALKQITEHPEEFKKQLKYVYISFALTGGIALLFALMPNVFFGDYMSMSEVNMLQDAAQKGYIPQDMLVGLFSNLQEMRQAVFVADAWRSFIIVTIGLVLLLLFNKKTINKTILVVSLLLLCIFDLWQVDKRYMNDAMFSYPVPVNNMVPKTATDEQILQDPDKDYRVMNLASSPFNESRTSYYHKSVGGYHPAKLRRYQEMVDEHIAKEMGVFAQKAVQTSGRFDSIHADTLWPVLNMLNVKYAIMGANEQQTVPVPNPFAMGNGWFVRKVNYVATADDEIMGLHKVNPRYEAVVNEKYKDVLGDACADDSTAKVELTAYDANALAYEVNSAKGGVVVFSEIYYPSWQAWVDGEPVEIACADYVLRAIKVAPGKHKVEFKFDPNSLHVTEGIANVAIVFLLLVLLYLLAREVIKRRKEK